MARGIRVYAKPGQDGTRILNYVYNATPEIGFHFHLLSEVGEPWQAQAKAKLAGLVRANPNYELKTIELDYKPWYVDALVKKTN